MSRFKKFRQKENTEVEQGDSKINDGVKKQLTAEKKAAKYLEEETFKKLEIIRDYGLDGDATDSRLSMVCFSLKIFIFFI